MLATIRSYPALVLATPRFEHRRRESVEQYKALIELIDGSYLHVNEVWIDGELKKYAYYWLTPTGVTIRGWDNAPHHHEVDTYPHLYASARCRHEFNRTIIG